jgi:hypothetical protein
VANGLWVFCWGWPLKDDAVEDRSVALLLEKQQEASSLLFGVPSPAEVEPCFTSGTEERDVGNRRKGQSGIRSGIRVEKISQFLNFRRYWQ